MRPFLLSLFALLSVFPGSAQKYRMESLTIADGLSQGFVSSILQDSRGFIWLGTLDGLNRYDGYQIKRFAANSRNPWALKANSIYCMLADSSGLLWLGTEKGLVVMDPYSERFVRLADVAPAFPTSQVRDILIRNGRIWIISQFNGKDGAYVIRAPDGLVRLIREGKVHHLDLELQYIPLSDEVGPLLYWIFTGSDTALVAVDRHSQLRRIDQTTFQLRSVDPETLPYQPLGNFGILTAPQKNWHFFFSRPVPDRQNAQLYSTGFLKLMDGTALLHPGSDCTLYWLDTTLFRSAIRGANLEDPSRYTLFKPFITADKPLTYTYLIDRSGSLWVSTTGYGVRKISRKKLDFKLLATASGCYNATLLPDGRLWMGFRRPEAVVNLQTGRLGAVPWAEAMSKDDAAHSLLISRTGDWWMIIRRKDHLELWKKEKDGRTWQDQSVSLPLSFHATPLAEDRSGNIWMAGIQGHIYRIRPDNRVSHWQINHLFPTQENEELFGTSLAEDESGTLWIGYNRGLVRLDHPDEEPAFYLWNSRRPAPLQESEWILSLYPEPGNTGVVWIGTRGHGLSRYDSRTGACETFTENEGLANNVVYGILADSFGYLWLSTNRGLSRFNLRNHTFSNFVNVEPEMNTEFNTGAYLALPSGELAFGGVDGLFLIHPQRETQAHQPCVVEVTQLKINGIPLDPGTMEPDQFLTARNEISLTLPFSRNNLILEFAALQTDDPPSAQYRYRVLGLGEQWIPIGHQHTVNLVAIPSGTYTIELQSIGSSDSWENALVTRLYVRIQAPWYLSWPAWWLYVSLICLVLYLYIRYERRQLGQQLSAEINRRELDQLKSLNDFKNRFFGYISHEFKTPLTIIMGQAKHLPAEQSRQKAAILQQGQSMLEMVDQMVDITRLDNQQLQLNWRNGNFSDYVLYLVESLRPLTEFKDLRLEFRTDMPERRMDFDTLRLKYIINNLLINAVQHTAPGGSIQVHLYPDGPDYIRLEVSDTGAGIDPSDLPRIFDRYYQGNSNNPQPHHFGLGLAFVKDLLQLFAGRIAVQSQPGAGTVFTVTLPVSQEAPPLEMSSLPPDYRSEKFGSETTDLSGPSSLPLLLIVEDNFFIADFLRACLYPHFALVLVTDGRAGYEKALEIVPDLILTDVMMPGMDGHELTNRLKSHELTSHIPVVMLSARSSLSDRLSGQRSGADAYVAKPFDEQELVLVLSNLHRLQARWRERYAPLSTQLGTIDSTALTQPEQPAESIRQTDAFMLKIYALFEKHYADEEYDLTRLCRDMKMSKSQLRRKLGALSDQSPMDLLRRYRLQKAYALLSQHPGSNVQEVCFQVGFKDASHFSRLFSKTFGMSPSDLRKAGLGK